MFTTKYRRGALTPEILDRCEQILADIATGFGAHLAEFNGEQDHVHLLLDYPPTLALSRFVNSAKGVTSRHLRREFPDHLSRYLWGGHLWSRSYYIGSTGGANLDTIKHYIHTQNRPTH